MQAQLEVALQNVVEAARAHLVALTRAQGDADSEPVWRAYVALNNATCRYDELLFASYGAISPWDVAPIDLDDEHPAGAMQPPPVDEPDRDPHPRIISVRQRRDYHVPSASGLLRLADATRIIDAGDDQPPVQSVGEAVLVLVEVGDGSLGSLDVPQLESFHGVVTVTEVAQRLDLDHFAVDDGIGPFQTGLSDRLVGRLDERPYPAVDESIVAAGRWH